MTKVAIAAFFILLALIAFIGFRTYRETSQVSVSPQKQEEDTSQSSIVAKGLEVPWALAFLPDNSILVTERKGTVRLIDKDRGLLPSPIATINVKQTGESGLHGIAIDPEFLSNHYVYLYYSYSADNNNSLNRVSRFTYEGESLKDEQVIVDKIPGAIFHDGGRIKFGPDKNLYITTGDAQNPSLSQDKNSLAGKILKIKDDNQVEVVSLGHRNPQGIAWDNQGRLWETEHGQSATDELNQIEQDGNYGWPTIRGEENKQGMENPIIQSGADTWAPAGMAYYNGSLYFGGLRGQALFQYIIDTKEFKTYFKGQFGRIRDVVLGPDNMLYITTSNRDGRGTPQSDDDKILRINPKKL